MTFKGKTTATRTRVSLVSLCAARILATAVSQTPGFVGNAQAADAIDGVTNPYTISIPSELSVGADDTGAMSITGEVAANHRLTVTASSANDKKLSGPANDAVAYNLVGASFTVSAHGTRAAIEKMVTATVNGTPRYEGTYTDTVTFTMSCVETYTLVFDAQGGTLPEGWENPRELAVGETYNLPTPTRDGFKFDGWYTFASGGTKVDASGAMGSADVQYYAHWTANILTIRYHNGGAYQWRSFIYHDAVTTFDENEDVVVETETVKYNGVLGDQGDHSQWGIFDVGRLTRRGYHETSNWRVGSLQSEFLADGVKALADGKETAQHLGVLGQLNVGDVTVELYPVFAPNKYHVLYDANGGTGSMSQTDHVYDTPTSLRTCTFTRDGYMFAGWSTSAEGTAEYTDAQQVNMVTDNGGHVTLYAQWTKAETANLSSGEASAADTSASSNAPVQTDASAAQADANVDASAPSQGVADVPTSSVADSESSDKVDASRDGSASSGAQAIPDTSAAVSDDAVSSAQEAGDASDSGGADVASNPDFDENASDSRELVSSSEGIASAGDNAMAVQPAQDFSFSDTGDFAIASLERLVEGEDEGSQAETQSAWDSDTFLVMPTMNADAADVERPLAESSR